MELFGEYFMAIDSEGDLFVKSDENSLWNNCICIGNLWTNH
jgi:hypothetical protein